MRKVFMSMLAVMMAFTFMFGIALADDCAKTETAKKTDCEPTPACKKICPHGSKAKATLTTAEGEAEKAETVKTACADLAIAIDGMTCTGCEKAISDALTKHEGVLHMKAISHKEGMAVVCYDPAKAEMAKLISAVNDMGYTAKEMELPEKYKDCTTAEKAAHEGCPHHKSGEAH